MSPGPVIRRAQLPSACLKDVMGRRSQDPDIVEIGAVPGEKPEAEETSQAGPIELPARSQLRYGGKRSAQSGPVSLLCIIGVQGTETIGPDMPLSFRLVPGPEK